MPSIPLLDFAIGLSQTNPQFAAGVNAAGLTRHFVTFLGSPAWVLKGTRFPPGSALPVTITMAEDLRLLANLEAHLGLPEMLRQMMVWPHTFAETFFLNAPDLRAALALLVAKVDRSNDHITVTSELQDKGLVFSLVPDIRIGPFRTLITMLTVAFLYRLVSRFCGPESAALLQVTTTDSKLAGPLQPLALRVRHVPAAIGGATSLLVPHVLLDSPSPSHLPSLWQHILFDEALAQTLHASVHRLDRDSLTELFTASLQSKQRLPQHSEVARMLNVSERTLARRLARQGLSLRNCGEEARKKVAMQLLAGSDLPVGTIAAQLGYSNPAGFSRSFRAWTGQTPRGWRMAERKA